MLKKWQTRSFFKAAVVVTVVGWIAVGCSATPGAVSEDKELAEFWVSEDYQQLFLRLVDEGGEQYYAYSPCTTTGLWSRKGDIIDLHPQGRTDIYVANCPDDFSEASLYINSMMLLPDGKAELVSEETGEKFIFKESTEEEWTKSNKLP